MLKLVYLMLFTSVMGKDLPGLDYLESGFDALKMISNNEDTTSTDRLKFRLFNLRIFDGDEFILETMNKSQSFKTPSVVQVTNINMRNRVSVESISYTFQDFFKSYFYSYSFGMTIPMGPIPIALNHHKTFQELSQTIKEKKTAIGMSTDWLGMFSVQLAPSYILPFDPVFNRSLSKLVSNPTTDTQQMYYNQLILTFGTHYTSSIILGGTVEMFTQVNSEYQQTHKKTTLTEQIGISFGYQQGQMSVSLGSGGTVALNEEEFRKNSVVNIEFSPIVSTTSETENKQWDIWFDRASSTPVVVNRTISPLINVLIEYPIEIRRHLQLTIDYYLKTGKVPTIEQLSNVTQRKKRSINDRHVLPGLDVVGCGYDISSLKSRSCLLDMTMNDNTTWMDVFDSFTTYNVPDGYFVTGTKDLLAMYDTAFFNTFQEFITQSYVSNRQDSAGFLGFGASTNTEEMRTRYSRFYQHKYRMAWTKQQVIWFTLAAATFPPPKFSRIASLVIDRLPTTFDPQSIDYKKFELFFNSYGTHIVVQADIGGMLWAEDYFESCLITKMTEKWIRREITKRYWFFGSSREIEETYHKDVVKEYQENSLSNLKIIGGLTTVVPLTAINWIPTVKDNPSPVTYRLQPIYTLLPLGAQRDALKEATLYFRSAIANSTNLYIQRLESETTPPQLPKLKCTERRRRKKRNVKKNIFILNLSKARDKLCPIVGFYGMFCPGKTTAKYTDGIFDSANKNQTKLSPRVLPIRSLPRSIGMAINIATGEILLPALSLTEGSVSWTDSESGQTFLLPNEVTVSQPEITDNNVSVRIFPTENELVQLWLHNYETRQWSGGEFARTQNVLDVHEKFFKDGQATAISQDLKVVYTVSMKSADTPKALSLNEYAQAAINALTVKYDQTLYDDFIDAWGTHITVSNKVGGMTEQQVIFKNCIINTTKFTNGISQSSLERNLKQELLNRRPCIDHFYWLRRKKYLDHRVGGNVLLINNTDEWKKTIIQNPALISISKYTPWYDVISNETIQANLRRAIEGRINATNAIRQEQVKEIQVQRANMPLATQVVYGYSMRESPPVIVVNPNVSILTPNVSEPDWKEIKRYSFTNNSTLHGSKECRIGIESNSQLARSCGVGEKKMGACSYTKLNNQGIDTIVVASDVPITYERNHTTGSFRVVARRQYGEMVYNNPEISYINNDTVGDWVHVGCSIIRNQCIEYSKAYDTTNDIKEVYLCSGCDVKCADEYKRECSCYCPIYETDPEADPFEPYCR